MPATSAKEMILELDDGVATAAELCVTDFNLNIDWDVVDATTLCDDEKIETPTFKNVTFDGDVVIFDTADDAVQALVRDANFNGTTLNWTFYPLGTGTGNPSYSGTLYVTGFTFEGSVGEIVRGSITMTNAGPVTYVSSIP